MKILVVCQYYAPEPVRIADLCEELVCRGHEVHVVTGTPNYPMGDIYPGYEGGRRADEVLNGVRVHRCRIAPRRKDLVNRVRNYFSFPRAAKAYIRTLDDSYDVVFVNQLSPVMMGEAGMEYKRRHGKKLVLYCLDLWPESLCVGGVKRGGLIYNVFKRISGRIYRAADELIVTSRMFADYFDEKFDIDPEQVRYLPQYAESQFLELEEKPQGETFRLLFAGNLGAAQSLETVVEAARLLQGRNIVFDLVGDGSAMESLQQQAQGLDNVIFHGRRPLEDMPGYYRNADAALITLTDDPVISLTLPGKVQTYMAAGRPVVGAINGETALVLQEAQGGFCVGAGDARGLAEQIVSLMESGRACEIGRANRAYYQKYFSKDQFMDQLVDYLERNVSQSREAAAACGGAVR